ncbi:hypothetical protein [Phenylobacterium sp. J367]|uniref:hypothetical protein n=1 Tax=Phenylobacterium sp. J367 TaxID=2898435 RepID=UPI0021507BB2|nr:hypothetical protein [Phenylobacterium sp. J367]MCR5879440.1 hypothetical protein [Phenylobacterium sp. J367]
MPGVTGLVMMTPDRLIRLLAAISVLLALGCAALAVAWSRANDEALCWRDLHELGEVPPEGDCRRL